MEDEVKLSPFEWGDCLPCPVVSVWSSIFMQKEDLMLYCHLQHHNDTIIKTQEDFFINIFTSHFIVRVRKGLLKVCLLETKYNCNILTPTLMAVSIVSFLFSWCSIGGPAAQLSTGWWLSLLHLISIFSGPELIMALSPFGLVWLSLPHLVYSSISNCNWNCNSLTSVLPTQSPTQSLKSHVWSSSSGNNCHAVHRSLSSGASVYECTMGIFLFRPISSANFRPHNFLS